MSSRVNEVNGENLQDPQSEILATPMNIGQYKVNKLCKNSRYLSNGLTDHL